MKKKMTHKLTKEQKTDIIRLVLEGFSPTEISKEFGISRSTVYYYHKKYKEENGED